VAMESLNTVLSNTVQVSICSLRNELCTHFAPMDDESSTQAKKERDIKNEKSSMIDFM
jgi:hypothetical protein